MEKLESKEHIRYGFRSRQSDIGNSKLEPSGNNEAIVPAFLVGFCLGVAVVSGVVWLILEVWR